MVRTASTQAKQSGKEVRLRWYKKGIQLWVAEVLQEKEKQGLDKLLEKEPENLAFYFEADEVMELKRVAARSSTAQAEWSFWSNGVREPAEIAYKSPLGTFHLRFGALVADPDIVFLKP